MQRFDSCCLAAITYNVDGKYFVIYLQNSVGIKHYRDNLKKFLCSQVKFVYIMGTQFKKVL